MIALLLGLFAVSGLMAGALTHILTTAPTSGVTKGAPSSHVQPTHTPAPTATATTAPVAVTGVFTLAISIQPANTSLTPGQSFQVIVHALRPGGQTPVVGLRCALGAPTSGAPLLAQWPAPATTNASGDATWQITVPNSAPGKYKIEASAHGSDGSYYFVYMSVTIA